MRLESLSTTDNGIGQNKVEVGTLRVKAAVYMQLILCPLLQEIVFKQVSHAIIKHYPKVQFYITISSINFLRLGPLENCV